MLREKYVLSINVMIIVIKYILIKHCVKVKLYLCFF
jgi:hypothetical protein